MERAPGREGWGAREPLRPGTIVPLIGFLLLVAGPRERDPPGPAAINPAGIAGADDL